MYWKGVGTGSTGWRNAYTSYQDNSGTTTPGYTFEQDGSGDALIQWLLTGTQAYTGGIDNSDSDKFKFGAGNNGFTNNMAYEINTTGNVTFLQSAAVTGQAVTVAGALTLGKTYHSLSNSSGSSYAVTLAAPTSSEDGVGKAIKMIAGDGTNTVTLAPTNVVGGSAATTATFDSAGEILILQAAGGKWVVIKEFGVTLT